jgi:hypothetical protein
MSSCQIPFLGLLDWCCCASIGDRDALLTIISPWLCEDSTMLKSAGGREFLENAGFQLVLILLCDRRNYC